MQGFLDPLAAVYARSWVHNDDLYHWATVPFVWMHASCPLADGYPAEVERYHDLRVGTLAGELDIHQQLNAKLIEGNPELGFHAKVLEG